MANSAGRGMLGRIYGFWAAIAAAFALSVGFAGQAQAKWREAQSDHFVVYANDSEDDIREFAEDLEKFHSALVYLAQQGLGKPSPSNRVTIYVVGNDRRISKMAGNRFVRGFYIPRAGASAAFVPQVGRGERRLDGSMIVLLHEYSHHFFTSTSQFPIPRWLSEGSAEFFASASYEREGALIVGMPAQHRARELHQLRDVPIEQLFDNELYQENKGSSYDSYYGWSWLLFHYLMFEDERSGQYENYVRYLVEGEPSLNAASKAFGDLETLETELKRYMRRGKIYSLRLPPSFIKVGEVTVRTLREGEEDMMPLRIQSRRGVSREEALELLPEAREIGAKYPNDPMVQAALAEAEFDAGNDAEAIAAADRALAADPDCVDAYVQKGYALFRMAEDADDMDAAYQEALKPFLALNKVENDHPLPLAYYYRSFVARGEEPSDLAKQGLSRAVDLARFDLDLRMQLAMQQMRDGDYEKARQNLAPIAFNPHGGGMAGSAQRLIKRLESSSEPVDAVELSMILAPELDVPEVEEPDADE